MVVLFDDIRTGSQKVVVGKQIAFGEIKMDRIFGIFSTKKGFEKRGCHHFYHPAAAAATDGYQLYIIF